MLNMIRNVRINTVTLLKLLPIVAFVIPFLILYFNPDPYYLNSFEMTWKGRTFYIFFLWLALLELVLSWDKLQTPKVQSLKSVRTVAFVLALLIPTVYVVVSNYCGLHEAIVNWVWNYVTFRDWMPLAIEYLVLAFSFVLIILLEHGTSGLKELLISPLLLTTIGIVYAIDNIYPQGRFTPFQMLVPVTATAAANVLNLMGYQTRWEGEISGAPILTAWNEKGAASFGIAWPCSGIESLLIYTLTLLLFLKNTPIPWRHRLVYFVIGAIVTFFINVLRIVTLYQIAIDHGARSVQFTQFHNLYGQLYSMIWILSYPLIIIAGRALWIRISSARSRPEDNPVAPKTKT